MDCSPQAPLSMEFSRQEYWSGVPFPAPGDFHNLGIKPMSPVSSALASGFSTTESPGRPKAIIKVAVTYSTVLFKVLEDLKCFIFFLCLYFLAYYLCK